jgi:hypothetical protein
MMETTASSTGSLTPTRMSYCVYDSAPRWESRTRGTCSIQQMMVGQGSTISLYYMLTMA